MTRIEDKKLAVLYSSFNNYDVLEKEAFKRINFQGFPIINVDDKSATKEREKGVKLCKENKIFFLDNSGKGLQNAVQTSINYCDENLPNCEWILCLQQDFFPLGENFFNSFLDKVEEKNLSRVGAIGFNCLDDSSEVSYSFGSLKEYYSGKEPKGFLGVFFLSDSKKNKYRMSLFYRIILLILKNLPIKFFKRKAYLYNLSKRVFSQKGLYKYDKVKKNYRDTFSIELPVWAGIAINIKKWKEYISVDNDYIFHLWFPDIAMQFLSQNINLAVIPDLYCHNEITVKEKYGMNYSSANAGMKNQTDHVEKLGNEIKIFESKWGFNYENPNLKKDYINSRYRNTLIEKYFNHDFRNGPLVKY